MAGRQKCRHGSMTSLRGTFSGVGQLYFSAVWFFFFLFLKRLVPLMTSPTGAPGAPRVFPDLYSTSDAPRLAKYEVNMPHARLLWGFGSDVPGRINTASCRNAPLPVAAARFRRGIFLFLTCRATSLSGLQTSIFRDPCCHAALSVPKTQSPPHFERTIRGSGHVSSMTRCRRKILPNVLGDLTHGLHTVTSLQFSSSLFMHLSALSHPGCRTPAPHTEKLAASAPAPGKTINKGVFPGYPHYSQWVPLAMKTAWSSLPWLSETSSTALLISQTSTSLHAFRVSLV